MLKRMNINWNARQLAKMCMNGSITFENAIQRGYVWDQKRKSLLIESMILGFPIPAFYAKRDENKNFDMLDGKQRSSAITEYLNNDFSLIGVDEEYEGKYFNELSEDTQDDIKSYSLTVYFFDEITDEEVNDMFYRLNNGKPLTAIELTRVKTKSFDKIKEISKHPIFTDALNDKQINKYTNEDIVTKALVMLNVENPSLKNEFIRPYLIETEITDYMADEVNEALTRIKRVHDFILDKGNVKTAKKLYTRTHMISVIPLVKESIISGVDVDKFADFIEWFYTTNSRMTSISNSYNSQSSSGSNSQYAVGIRDKELREHYERYQKEHKCL